MVGRGRQGAREFANALAFQAIFRDFVSVLRAARNLQHDDRQIINRAASDISAGRFFAFWFASCPAASHVPRPMNIRFPFVVSLLAIALSGCGQKDVAPAAATSTAPVKAAAVAAPAAAAPRVIEITANDTMKFSLATIEAKAGETIKIVLTNNGTLPKEAMGHNLVVLKPGTDGGAFCAAAMTAKATDYIPESLKGQVVAATALLGPRKSEEIILKDLKAGEYPYVCSFPAHFAVGMKGVLIVK